MTARDQVPRTALGEAWTRWLRRDHLLVSLGLAGLVLLAWVDLLRRAGVLSPGTLGQEMAMPQVAAWGWTRVINHFIQEQINDSRSEEKPSTSVYL